MSTFAEASIDAHLPVRYRDAQPGLRFRVVDTAEDHVPDLLATCEIGEGLVAVVTWGPVAVTADAMRIWGVSIDEVKATAAANISALPVERVTSDVDGAAVETTVGHHWVSSLVVDRAGRAEGEDGFLVAIPRSDVMAATPVFGAETVDGLEGLMVLCDEVYDPDDLGISPSVWWWYRDTYWRVTERSDDGTVDIQPHSNFVAHHLLRAIVHLAHPCAECGRE